MKRTYSDPRNIKFPDQNIEFTVNTPDQTRNLIDPLQPIEKKLCDYSEIEIEHVVQREPLEFSYYELDIIKFVYVDFIYDECIKYKQYKFIFEFIKGESTKSYEFYEGLHEDQFGSFKFINITVDSLIFIVNNDLNIDIPFDPFEGDEDILICKMNLYISDGEDYLFKIIENREYNI